MNLIVRNKNKIQIIGSTVDFYKYTNNSQTYIQFDCRKTSHPEPMLNAMLGLESLNNNEKLIMINARVPAGLFPKIENDFEYDVEYLEDRIIKVTFSKKNKANATVNTDFTDTSCDGGNSKTIVPQ